MKEWADYSAPFFARNLAKSATMLSTGNEKAGALAGFQAD